jgi:hypothetical protein
MGMPNIPNEICTNIDIDRNGLVDLLLMSIALEELSLAHIINSEGELMQLYIKKLRYECGFNKDELLKLNRSISETMRIVLEKEKTLKEKLYNVIQFNDDQTEHHHDHGC